MEFDQALRYLGNFGRYQILLYLILNIIASIFTRLQLIGMVFVSYTPKPYYCTPPEGFFVNETVPVFLDQGKETYDSCHMYVVQDGEVTENVTRCQFGWDFETVHGEQSVVTDFDLVCDDAILAKVSVSLFMTGILVGYIRTISGYLRQKTYHVHITDRFIPESARWLVSRGRVDEADKILTKIADFNNIPVPTSSFLTSRPQELSEEVVPLRTSQKQPDEDAIYKPVPAPRKQFSPSRHGHHGLSGHQSSTKIAHQKFIPPTSSVTAQSIKKHSLVDIFKSRVLLVNFLIMGYCWFVIGTVYYGLSLYSAELTGNVYFNVFLLCLVEVPAYVVAYFMMRWPACLYKL
ncbi:organic cation/carnitine transporter 2-like [Amphiura filiformis]|uniref:organic cation/carnitine transporter 2-like n=1 Tax=Amphiura filiformis TaxID=82378 RepID=UPI003B22416C